MTFNFDNAESAAATFNRYDTPRRKIFMSNYYFQSGLAFQQTFGTRVLRVYAGSAGEDFVKFRDEIAALIKERIDSEFASRRELLGQETDNT